MSSETVWFEQVDTAFVDYIKSKVKLLNSASNLVSVPVSVRKAEEDFLVETYPCMTIYNLYSRFDAIREGNVPIHSVVLRDAQTFSLVREKNAIPYNLYYQIDFWARTQVDMNNMTRLWLSNVSRDFILPVKDMSGINRNCLVLMTDDLKKADLIAGSKRTYHSFITYRVYVEIDEKVQESVPMIVTTVEEVGRI